jgi:uncharacterized protein YjbI with pentapeptide repeats
MADSEPNNTEQAERIRKLQLESALLERQLSQTSQDLERRKARAATAGIVAAIVALGGLMLSSYQWYATSLRTADIALDQRLARGLEQLGSAMVAQRLAAVASLSSAVHEKGDRRQQVLQALINNLALEDSPLVRNAILGTLNDLRPVRMGQDELDSLLLTLVRVNRGLVEEGHLLDSHRRYPRQGPGSQQEYRAASTVEAICILLKQGARAQDFSRTYLFGANFQDLLLQECNFSRAVLSWAQFDRAKLAKSIFDDAFLDGTSFTGADARYCRFFQSLRTTDRTDEFFVSYSDRQQMELAKANQGYEYEGPMFDCADLRGATFENHRLFTFSPDDGGRLVTHTTSFHRAILDGADFRYFGVLGIATGADACEPYLFQSCMGATEVGGPSILTAYFEVNTDAPRSATLKPPSPAALDRYAMAFQSLALSFAGSKWQRTRWPAVVRDRFRAAPPPSQSQFPCGQTHYKL